MRLILATLLMALGLAACGGDVIVDPVRLGVGEVRDSLEPVAVTITDEGEPNFTIELDSGVQATVWLLTTPDDAEVFAEEVAAGTGEVTSEGESLVHYNAVVTWLDAPSQAGIEQVRDALETESPVSALAPALARKPWQARKDAGDPAADAWVFCGPKGAPLDSANAFGMSDRKPRPTECIDLIDHSFSSSP